MGSVGGELRGGPLANLAFAMLRQQYGGDAQDEVNAMAHVGESAAHPSADKVHRWSPCLQDM